jgi:AraC-like DNA-binding protein
MTPRIMEMKQRHMVALLDSLAPTENITPSMLKEVRFFRISRPSPRTPMDYEPSILILAQGQKRVFLGDEVYTYDAFNYLVLSVPLPLDCETTASPEEPLLGIFISVDPSSVGELLLEMDDLRPQPEFLPRGIYSASLTEELTDSTIRLLEALSSPRDGRILGPMIVREILYRVLSGEQGGALQALAYRNGRFFQVARILKKIHGSFDGDLDVKTLALDAGMSISTFHANFKAVTNSSPLQYIKSVRLHKARSLMAQEGLNANTAANRVGYESPSQFSREFKRFFGVTPAKDAVSQRVNNEGHVASII